MCTPIGSGSYFGLDLVKYDEEKELKAAIEASLKHLEQREEKESFVQRKQENHVVQDLPISSVVVLETVSVKKEQVEEKLEQVIEAKKEEILLATKGEKWVDVKIGWAEQWAMTAFQKTAMRSVIEWRVRKVSDKFWERISKLDFSSYTRLGQFEEFAISLIKEAEYSDEEKKRVHQKVKDMLKLYAEKGLLGIAKKAASF